MPLSVPKFLNKAFAASGGKTNVPITGADINNGRADYENGFPPVTRAPIAAGGVPPYGTDMNGVLFDLSSGLQYLQAGVVFPYNQEFATAIGGYPKGARVADLSDTSIIYTSQINNNLSPPPGANWVIGASETIYGSTKYATQSETTSGTSDNLAITPLKFKSAFVASITASGYQKLPSGLIIQWGTGGGATSGSVIYPLAFANAAYSVAANTSGASRPGTLTVQLGSKTSFTYLQNAADAFYWMAIGL